MRMENDGPADGGGEHDDEGKHRGGRTNEEDRAAATASSGDAEPPDQEFREGDDEIEVAGGDGDAADDDNGGYSEEEYDEYEDEFGDDEDGDGDRKEGEAPRGTSAGNETRKPKTPDAVIRAPSPGFARTITPSGGNSEEQSGRQVKTGIVQVGEQPEQGSCGSVVAESGNAGNGERNSEELARVAGQSPAMASSVIIEGSRQELACCGLEEVPLYFLGGAEVIVKCTAKLREATGTAVFDFLLPYDSD